ncbi:hypothetical protein HG530_002774 [Fusarium avenaceum]|nr:hypothetical protein HG530_002774 [Fusarium avenaceum]
MKYYQTTKRAHQCRGRNKCDAEHSKTPHLTSGVSIALTCGLLLRGLAYLCQSDVESRALDRLADAILALGEDEEVQGEVVVHHAVLLEPRLARAVLEEQGAVVGGILVTGESNLGILAADLFNGGEEVLDNSAEDLAGNVWVGRRLQSTRHDGDDNIVVGDQDSLGVVETEIATLGVDVDETTIRSDVVALKNLPRTTNLVAPGSSVGLGLHPLASLDWCEELVAENTIGEEKHNSCIGALHLRVENSKRRVPCGFLAGDEEILGRRCLVDVCVLHADNIKNVTLNDILVGHVLSGLDDETEESMADVGVNGVGEGSVDRRSKVDLLKEILSCAGNGTWETRAVGSFALRDVGEAKCLPRL